ncbi:MAG: LytTR family DNA-binding domain-containing protein [Gammaproteobacteria bacterium]
MNDKASSTDGVSIRGRVRLWEFVVFGGAIAAIAMVNALTDLSNYARESRPLSPWEPFVWEYSSALLVWLLIPAVAWLNNRMLINARSWRWSLPAHLVATLPFSVVHVGGMVALRKLAYMAAGRFYDFGAPLSTWFYEYRKDFVTYWLILAALYAFRTYRLWLENRLTPPTVSTPNQSNGGLERLVVKKLNREFILNTLDIDRIEADGNYVTLYAQGTSYPLRDSLSSLEKKLDPRHFVRVHRGHIVNIDRIREIQPWDSGDYRILLKDGSFVNFSRRYRSRLSHLFSS